MSTSRATSSGTRGVEDLDSLREHLQWAIELEHCTLPPYLCALYSLDAERNAAAVEVVTSVFVEEMLHLTLAANLLNAVGGRPVLDSPRLLPGYPMTFPHGDRSFEIPLAPFGAEALEAFLRIEQPSAVDARAESEEYETIGQFYEAIRAGLVELSGDLGEAAVFCGDPERQVTSMAAYRGGGQVVGVTDLATALRALDEIVEQGEGIAHRDVWDGDHDMFKPDRDEVAHYFRFLELKLGRRFQRGDTPASGPTGEPVLVDWDAVRPMELNPRVADHPVDSPVRDAMDTFNYNYRQLLQQLETAFDGRPDTLLASVGAMYALKAQATALMAMTTGDGTTVAGPSFEYVSVDDRD
ncbi:hypothetical protein G5V58_04080 [Nocardioides anomalus]|uniref:Iminophenyl-pyruvate dimer synthase domain-containing protein n=1 Tax=Nocardioides anomalus TaxID=2712223 RepID=A0A6G6W9P1_9ACTN|nr:ferritin-like protein [Nocardioides anomalus]QIG42058.1 hypothetical protein G5V58_04080 [Nocardioides anomalus]